MTNVRVNKRTMLGGQYWTIAAVGLLTARGLPSALTVVLAIVGAYLVFWPAPECPREWRASRFLLRAK